MHGGCIVCRESSGGGAFCSVLHALRSVSAASEAIIDNLMAIAMRLDLSRSVALTFSASIHNYYCDRNIIGTVPKWNTLRYNKNRISY